MANGPAIFKMTKDDKKYTFMYRDGSYIENVEGTTQEIAHLLFNKLVLAPRDGYNRSISENSWPPFWIDDTDPKHLVITTDFLSKIEPEPGKAFWDELNEHLQRLMNLIVFA